MRRATLAGLIVVSLCCIAPAVCRAQDVGAYANLPVPHSPDWIVPAGHYALLASYADAFLSDGPSNGSYLLAWSVVKDELADFFVVDVRSLSAFNLKHLPGAINIPYADLAKPWNLALLPSDRPILVVCGSGQLSSQAATVLGMLGYSVRVLSGGMATVTGL